MEKKKNLFIVAILICLLFVLGTSYAIWQLMLVQTESNLVNTTCFKIEFKEENDITLQNSYPIPDVEGMSLTPYIFTIENICDTNAIYQINLETLKGDGKRLSDEYLKLSLNEEKGKSLNMLPEVSPTLSNTDVSHKLSTGVLKVGEKKEFSLRLWMSEDTPPIDEVMNASHESKITVTLIHKGTIPDVTILASEYLDGIKVQNTVSNLGNDVLTYFYKLDDGDEIVSSDAHYTFSGLNDGIYKVSVRIENQDGIIIKEETKDVVIAYEHVYVSSSGNDTTGIGSMENPFLTLQPAYNKVKSGGEILLLSDITATSTTNMNIENKSVTLKSSGDNSCSIFRGDALKTAIIDVSNTNTLTISHITLDGKNINANSSLIEGKTSTINLNDGTKLTRNIHQGKYYEEFNSMGAHGGGIYISYGILNINQAIISDNQTVFDNNIRANMGGGVSLYQSTANFNGGMIVSNSSLWTGGGVMVTDSNFYMNGGVIASNFLSDSVSDNIGGGISIYSYRDNATVYVNGGNISKNTSHIGGGIYAFQETNQAIIHWKNGTIEGNIAEVDADICVLNGAQLLDER